MISRPRFDFIANSFSVAPGLARALRVAGWAAFAGWLLFVAIVLALRYAVLPKIADYRADIEQAATRAVGQPVRIGRVEARWRGLNPDLVLDDVVVADRQGGTAFSLSRVEGVLSWLTLLRGRPTLALLAIDAPMLKVRRDASGRLTVAGMDTDGESDPETARWLLDQRRIRVRDATIVWEDQLRGAPQLVLEDLQFSLDNRGSKHRFGLSAAPPDALAARIEVRGEMHGDIGETLENLSGKLFVELDYADLAGWRTWVDYPVRLPQGRGALRVWADLDDATGHLTADVALEAVRIRLGKQLPELDLASLRGRVEGRYRADEWSLSGQKLELLTRDNVRVAPTDFTATWRRDARTAAVDGEIRGNFVDVGVFSQLAGYLPLDAETRRLLDQYRPQGRVADFKASWRLVDETLARYGLKAAFTGLGVEPAGYFPGGGGLAGTIEANEKGGTLILDAGKSHVSLPAVFPEPDIDFDQLKAKVAWNIGAGGSEVRIERLAFAGPDAAGSAQGRYRYNGEGPGVIDLQASIGRADGASVWRYMPHAVSADARNWLRRGIVAGQASDGKLVLKGDLRNFPFRDPATGTFAVTAKVTNAKIDYADGWPLIDGVDAEMSFGVGMRIQASRGRVLGASLADVRVEIPDFESHEEMLLVRGGARGPTLAFLHFLDQSPVGASIDRFTEGMKAEGDGYLALELDIPLRRVRDTRIRGDYRFQNNTLQPLAGLPPISQVNGRLAITERSVVAQDINGHLFGGPVRVQVRNAGDRVSVQASGTAKIAEVARHFAWPLVDQLTGQTGWKADIGIRKRNASMTIESDLVGVSSPLPEPLNKTAATPLPLHVERSLPEGAASLREQYRITVGKVAQGLVVRKNDSFEKGVFAVGSAEPRLPDSGLAVRVALPRIDADAWRNFIDSGGEGSGDGGAALSLVALKTPHLRLFGRDFSQVDLNLRPRSNGWQIGLNTREAIGDIFWRSNGEGWVEGNFRKLVLTPAGEVQAGSTALINSLPGMSLSVDDFQVGDKALGRLELKARNEKGAWRLDTLSVQNPDGALVGKGVWINTGRQQTRLDFELNARDVGRLLDRFGFAGAVRRGSAKLAGNLQWNGAPTGIDYPSLGGQMSVDVEKGQFNQLEPGVGKLLGLISLQSLPRRLMLDFRDIYSTGLAFDSIEGKLALQNGTMRTVEPLRIFGPAVQIEMEGETDLQRETQDLRVVVRPELGGLAAVGTAALINPAVGAAALVANTVLQKPLNRLFSYRYHVTGTWSDPLVDKAGATPQEGRPVVKEAQ